MTSEFKTHRPKNFRRQTAEDYYFLGEGAYLEQDYTDA